MIFELRTYDLKPGKALDYIDHLRTFGIALVTRHLPLGGYWMVETGRLNRIQHLWIYENFAERDSCRAGLAEDSAWVGEFMPTAFADVVAQENRFMHLERSSEDFDAVVASRKSTHDNQSADAPRFSASFHGLTVSASSGARGGHLAQFRVVSGAAPGSFVTLSAGAADEILVGSAGAMSHELMRPLSLSPLR